MRISTLQTFNNAVDQMQRGQTELARTQQRIASGKELLRPSDDPVAAAQILKLNREVARIDKFEENIEVTDRRLQLEEMTLEQINTASDRLKELTIQAGSAVLTDADRGFIADEARQLQDQILGLMNTKDAAGEYLFGGSKGSSPPFVKEVSADGSETLFAYKGDDGQRLIQVGPELRIPSTDSGRDIFQVIPGEVGAVRAFGVDTSIVVNPTVIDAESYDGDLAVSVREDGDNPGTYLYTVSDGDGNILAEGNAPAVGVEAGGLSFNVDGLAAVDTAALQPVKVSGATAATSDPTVTDAAAYKTFIEDNGDVELTFDKTTTPHTFTVRQYPSGNPVTPALGPQDFSSGTIAFGGLALTDINIKDGDTLVLGAEAKVTIRGQRDNHSILQTAEDLITALETPLDSPQARLDYTEQLGKIHEELNIAKEGNLRVRTQLGARMNSVEAAAGANADLKLFTETALSQIQDLDYASAISEFRLQETALQAAQQTFSRISQLSLFNYL